MKLSVGIAKNWSKLVGSPVDFPIEIRIFRSICLISFLALAYNVIYNLALGFPADAAIDLVVIVFDAALIYFSYFKKWHTTSIIIFVLVIYILVIVSYFLDAGISGPNDLQMLLSLLLVICVTPKRQRALWFFINVLFVMGLHAVEYYHPELLPDHYPDRKTKFVDISSSYLVVALLTYFTINYFRINYNYEKRIADDGARALNRQHHLLLEQRDELERLNSEKDKLMSIVAHDLRAPLSNIQNYLELITAYGLDSDERRIVEGDLIKVTQSTMNMLSKLLLWSKAQMDGVIVKPERVSVAETLQIPLELEMALAAKKGILFNCNIDGNVLVTADGDMLQIVIRNLANNAIKFTPSGGRILIDTTCSGHLCRIRIKDTGTGIPYDQQSSLFSLQARSTYGTNNEKGVGLGLLLCKEFTELQGGTLSFESAPGGGSTFFVDLPLA